MLGIRAVCVDLDGTLVDSEGDAADALERALHALSKQDGRAVRPLFPDERLRMELPNDPGNMTTRIIDVRFAGDRVILAVHSLTPIRHLTSFERGTPANTLC